jgi:hypothetical protein
VFVYAWVQHEFLPGIVDKKMIAGSSAASDPNRHRALEPSAAAVTKRSKISTK